MRDEFIENAPKIDPLYHVVCLVWAHSKYYGTNGRMIVLFRMINNMMIECASKFLDPGSIFQGEPDECLVGLTKVIEILEEHKRCFEIYREKLPTYALPDKVSPMWSFLPKDIFERFDRYMKRLYRIRAIFDMANEFYKIEKIELGGVKGRALSRIIQEINNDFKNVYIKWTQIQFDPLDPSSKEFDVERKQFERDSEVLERKLSSVLVQAFDECHSLESFMKFVQICGTLLLRPLIFDEVKEKLNKFTTFYMDDLDMVKEIYDDGVKVIEKYGISKLQVDNGFPPVAGTLTWIKRMKRRITKPIEEMPYIEIKSIFDMTDIKKRVNYMCSLFDDLEKKVYGEWKRTVPNDILINMEKYLIKFRDDNNELLEVNFDTALITALKEIRMLKALGKTDIPDTAIELHENADQLWVSNSL